MRYTTVQLFSWDTSRILVGALCLIVGFIYSQLHTDPDLERARETDKDKADEENQGVLLSQACGMKTFSRSAKASGVVMSRIRELLCIFQNPIDVTVHDAYPLPTFDGSF